MSYKLQCRRATETTWTDTVPDLTRAGVVRLGLPGGEFATHTEAERARNNRAFIMEAPHAQYRVLAVQVPILTTDKQSRKETPMARGLVDYFPRALAAVSHVSFVANEQHNPGQPMHWSKGKSADHADCIMRHLVERGTVDDDTLRHSAKLAWRALALLETELEDLETK